MTTADVHCPDCGALTSVRREPCETLLVCPNDDCPQIIVQVNSRPSAERATDRLMHDLDKIYTVLP